MKFSRPFEIFFRPFWLFSPFSSASFHAKRFFSLLRLFVPFLVSSFPLGNHHGDIRRVLKQLHSPLKPTHVRFNLPCKNCRIPFVTVSSSIFFTSIFLPRTFASYLKFLFLFKRPKNRQNSSHKNAAHFPIHASFPDSGIF